MAYYRNHLGRHYVGPDTWLTDDEVAAHLEAVSAIRCTDDETHREVICSLDALAEHMVGRTHDHDRRLAQQILDIRQDRVGHRETHHW